LLTRLATNLICTYNMVGIFLFFGQCNINQGNF
jgi:hypothetical protein